MIHHVRFSGLEDNTESPIFSPSEKYIALLFIFKYMCPAKKKRRKILLQNYNNKFVVDIFKENFNF